MPKVRVYELARELELPNKEILDRLAQAGIVVRSHSSSVDEEEARAALKAVAAKKKKVQAPLSKAARPAPKPAVEKKEGVKAKAPVKVSRKPAPSRPTAPAEAKAAPRAQLAPRKEEERPGKVAVVDREGIPPPVPLPAAPPGKPAPRIPEKVRPEGKVAELAPPLEVAKPVLVPAAPPVIRISESVTVKELSE
ncbi:MAG: translation initiation factor IF-2 N-terminal domain-containing protein, partial [candidate division NC10 bacterium]|nr:translation initiation factor IF-2 N-terminal domain-containing protein [candidate division NC10 bacterium]